MKITITYDDEEQAKTALNGWKLEAAIDEIKETIFRSARKHGYADPRLAKAHAAIDALCEEHKLEQDLTWFIGELESAFFEILSNVNS